MYNLGIITYNAPHLKTEQIVLNILNRYTDYKITLFALPFVEREKRQALFNHRPNQNQSIHPQDLCRAFKLDYIECKHYAEIKEGFDFYIIAGANLLSESAVKNKKIINCHPGIIPSVRGLDSFKWAVYNGIPLGNTLHYVDADIDSGDVISIVPTPVFATDSIESLARRHYENEIRMLSDFDLYLTSPVNHFSYMTPSVPSRRMNIETEKEMIKRFDDYKKNQSKSFTL